MKFNIGDRVRWSSQAQGFRREKQGVIVEVVPAGQRPDRNQFESLYRGSGCGWGRKHESYVVNAGKPGRVAKYYWPVTSVLIPGA